MNRIVFKGTILPLAHEDGAQSGRPIIHLNTWRMDKEKLARKRQEQISIDTGLIGAWSCLEGCWSYRALQGGREKIPGRR